MRVKILVMGLISLLVLGSVLSASDKKTFKIFQLSYVALDYVDVSMTLYGIQLGYSEMNPLARWHIKSPPLTVAVHVVLNVITIKLSNYIYKRNKKLGWATIICLNMIKIYVIYRNTKTLLHL